MIPSQTLTETNLNKDGYKRIVQILFTAAFMAAVLMISAGRLDWTAGWIIPLIYIISIPIVVLLGIFRYPVIIQLINRRGKVGENTKGWDRLLLGVSFPFILLIWIIAGLDAGRFGWSTVPIWIQVIGLLMCLSGFNLNYWAMFSNAFLETTVRIQEERGHQVARGGPYRFIRHPFYVGMILSALGSPLLLGSWWAVIPAFIYSLIFTIRTWMEDKTLIEELTGYNKYASEVKFRLIPGIW